MPEGWSIPNGVERAKGVWRALQEAVNLRERADLLEPLAHLRVRGRELRDLGLEIRQLRVEQLPLDGRAECVAVLVARSHHDCGEAQR